MISTGNDEQVQRYVSSEKQTWQKVVTRSGKENGPVFKEDIKASSQNKKKRGRRTFQTFCCNTKSHIHGTEEYCFTPCPDAGERAGEVREKGEEGATLHTDLHSLPRLIIPQVTGSQGVCNRFHILKRAAQLSSNENSLYHHSK